MTDKPLPTIADFHEALGALVGANFGHLPAQLLIVPDATLQVLRMSLGPESDSRPALMLQMANGVLIASTDRMEP